MCHYVWAGGVLGERCYPGREKVCIWCRRKSGAYIWGLDKESILERSGRRLWSVANTEMKSEVWLQILSQKEKRSLSLVIASMLIGESKVFSLKGSWNFWGWKEPTSINSLGFCEDWSVWAADLWLSPTATSFIYFNTEVLSFSSRNLYYDELSSSLSPNTVNSVCVKIPGMTEEPCVPRRILGWSLLRRAGSHGAAPHLPHMGCKQSHPDGFDI